MADVGIMAASPSHLRGQSPHQTTTPKSQQTSQKTTPRRQSQSRQSSRSRQSRSSAHIASPDPEDKLSQYTSRMTNDEDSRRRSRLSRMTRPQSLLPQSDVNEPSHDDHMVRDFAYAVDDPYHYGAPPTSSGTTTPASEYSRRLSDPMQSFGTNNRYSAGQWGDGMVYDEPDFEMEPLPSTSFNNNLGGDEDHTSRKGKHRKSRSYADMSDYERDRGRRKDPSLRRSRDSDLSKFGQQQQQHDPAGREGLRLSRGFIDGSTRRDSHIAAAAAQERTDVDPDTAMPLDEEISLHHPNSPGRESMGSEDESVRGKALALYDFEPENPNELRLTERQLVNIAYRNGHGWLVAQDPATGEQGLVPEAYVRHLRDVPNYDEELGEFVDEDEEDEAP